MDNFYHDDQVMKGFCDFRSDISQPPSLNTIFYIVLRVKTGNAVWYHHTAMAIDGDLYSHIESLKCVLRASLNRPKAEIACVFVRSFITQDSSFMSSADHQGIIKQMKDMVDNGAIFCDEVKQILVLGFVGNDKIILFNVTAKDAMDAIQDVIKSCAEQFQENLNPFDIMAVSPAVPGIINLFEKRAPQLLAHVNSTCSAG